LEAESQSEPVPNIVVESVSDAQATTETTTGTENPEKATSESDDSKDKQRTGKSTGEPEQSYEQWLETKPSDKEKRTLFSMPVRLKSKEPMVKVLRELTELVKKEIPDEKPDKKKTKKLAKQAKVLLRQCSLWQNNNYPEYNNPDIPEYNLVECNPMKGECPPDRRDEPYANVYKLVRDYVKEDGSKVDMEFPCVTRVSKLTPQQAKEASVNQELMEAMQGLDKLMPAVMRRIDTANAVEKCRTFRTRGMCEYPTTKHGDQKCRVSNEKEDGTVDCTETSAYLRMRMNNNVASIENVKKQLKYTNDKLNSHEFSVFLEDAAGLTAVKNAHGDDEAHREWMLLREKREHLTSQLAILVHESQADYVTLNTEDFNYNVHRANDALCQDRRVSANSKRVECMTHSDDLCIISRFGLPDGPEYFENFEDFPENDTEEGKKAFMGNDQCVSRDGKGISYRKDKRTGKLIYLDKNNRPTSRPRHANWWNADQVAMGIRNSSIALGKLFNTGLSGVRKDLSVWTRANSAGRQAVRSAWSKSVEEKTRELFRLKDQGHILYKQLEALLTEDAFNTIRDELGTNFTAGKKYDREQQKKASGGGSDELGKNDLKHSPPCVKEEGDDEKDCTAQKRTVKLANDLKTGLIATLKDMDKVFGTLLENAPGQAQKLVLYFLDLGVDDKKDNDNADPYLTALLTGLKSTKALVATGTSIANDIIMRLARFRFSEGEAVNSDGKSFKDTVVQYAGHSKDTVTLKDSLTGALREVKRDSVRKFYRWGKAEVDLGGNVANILSGNDAKIENVIVPNVQIGGRWIVDPELRKAFEEKDQSYLKSWLTWTNQESAESLYGELNNEDGNKQQAVYKLRKRLKDIVQAQTSSGYNPRVIFGVRTNIGAALDNAADMFTESWTKGIDIMAGGVVEDDAMSFFSTDGEEESLMSTDGEEESLMSTASEEESLMPSLMSTASEEESLMPSLMSTASEEESLMSTASEEESLMSTASEEESLMSTEGEEESLMSTEGKEESLMSTEGKEESLMSTEGEEESLMPSLMSTEGEKSTISKQEFMEEIIRQAQALDDKSNTSNSVGNVMSTNGEISFMSTEDGSNLTGGSNMEDIENISFMSTEKSFKPKGTFASKCPDGQTPTKTGHGCRLYAKRGPKPKRVASLPANEELISLMSTEKGFGDSLVSSVASVEIPSVQSMAVQSVASSVDVDRLYEEYYAPTASTTSSVSHL